MKQAKVDSTHSTYDKNQPKRDLFAAVMGGTDGVRAGQSKYLPKYPAEVADEYQARLSASTIDGVVADGRDGLVGKVFHADIDVSKVNPAIVPLLENIDNEGNSFDVFARRAFESAFDGASIIIIDTPQVSGPVRSLEDERRLGIRPYWRLYKAKDVTNWRYGVDPISKKTRLEMLVLRECAEVPDGDFGVKEIERYRVYRHAEMVTQELWEKVDKEFIQTVPPIALDLTAIPAAIIGSLDCEPWLLNEAQLEIKAYQKESSFDIIEYLSIPVFYTIGYDKEDPIPFGASTHVRMPGNVDAAVGFAQIDSAGHASLKGTIDGIKQEIAGKLDAITKEAMPQTDQTATEVVSDDSKSQARLIVWAGQLKDALEAALMFTGQFMSLGDDKGGEIVLMTAWEAAKQAAAEAKDMANKRSEAEITKLKAA